MPNFLEIEKHNGQKHVAPHMKHHIGAANELDVASILLRMGCEVFTSAFGFSEVDLIALTPTGVPVRIQVKAASLQCKGRNGERKINTARQDTANGGTLRYTRVDFFVGCAEGKYWIFPAADCTGVTKRCLPGSRRLNAWHLIVDAVPSIVPNTTRIHLLDEAAS